MRISYIDNSFILIDNHLRATGSRNTEIESLLTRAMLNIIYSCFEEKINELIEIKLDQLPNPHLKYFTNSCLHAVLRDLRYTDISGFLGKFGEQFKLSFQSKADNDKIAITFYGNIITNRHLVSHTSGLNCTFSELKLFYEKGHKILDYFSDTLNEII